MLPHCIVGSYGNGAGMRAHPLALGCYGQPQEVIVDTAVNVARITHAHRHGVTGGVLQTLAVHQVSQCSGSEGVTCEFPCCKVVSFLVRLSVNSHCEDPNYVFEGGNVDLCICA